MKKFDISFTDSNFIIEAYEWCDVLDALEIRGYYIISYHFISDDKLLVVTDKGECEVVLLGHDEAC